MVDMAGGIQQLAPNGAQLGYEVWGAGEAKPPLVFAHGYAMRGTGQLYAGLLERLAERYSVHALDLRGHGASAAAVGGWSYEAVADDLAGFAPALGLAEPVFVGHSFGCVVGLLAEMRRPGSFKALCLLQPGPADTRQDPVDTLDALIAADQDRDALRDGFAQMFVRDPGDKLEQVLDAAVLVHADVHRAQKAQNPRFSIAERLKDVAAPALILCGENDSVVEPARQKGMADRLTRAKAVVLPGEGHMLAVENAAAACREVFALADSAVS